VEEVVKVEKEEKIEEPAVEEDKPVLEK